MKFEWEMIDNNTVDKKHFAITHRAKVIGGWIVHNATKLPNVGSESMVFIPDPNHEWTLE
jgi:hypothetical protein